MPVVWRAVGINERERSAQVSPTQPTIMAPEPHVKYRLVNAKSGTVLDLSGTNQTTSTSFVARRTRDPSNA